MSFSKLLSSDDVDLEEAVIAYITNSERFLQSIADEAVADYEKKQKRRRVRRAKAGINFWETAWGRIYQSPNVSNPSSFEGESFEDVSE